MSTVNKIQMRYNVVQANIKEGYYPNEKWYARVRRNGTLSLRGLAKHVAAHSSIYTLDVIYGVLVKFSSCLMELIEQGVAVKLDTLGTFYPMFESEGAVSAEDFTPEMIKGVHVRFLPESNATDQNNSKQLLQRCRFVKEAAIDKNKKVVKYYQYEPTGEDEGEGGEG